jgi:drug/metabolite transporter (DMT)-like permease
MAWLVLVLSIAAVGLMYWLIRRSPATGFASLFYLVPVVTAFFAFILFDERLDSISMPGMVICAGGVALVNRGTSSSSNMAAQSRSKRSQASSPKSG